MADSQEDVEPQGPDADRHSDDTDESPQTGPFGFTGLIDDPGRRQGSALIRGQRLAQYQCPERYPATAGNGEGG